MQIDDREEGGKMDGILDVCRCVICFNPWTREGDNQICCLPCGHLFGYPCSVMCIQQSSEISAKCPKCMVSFRGTDVRKIYGSPLTVLDKDLLARNKSLEEQNEHFINEIDTLLKENTKLKKQMNMHWASILKHYLNILIISIRQMIRQVSSSSSSPQTQWSDEMTRNKMQIEKCAICLEPWSCEGDHQVCCLPCGHLLGFSCIVKFIQQPYKKCPQCMVSFKRMDVRKIYGSPEIVIDQDLLNRSRSLQKKNGRLRNERDNLLEENIELKKQIKILRRTSLVNPKTM